MYAMLNIPRHNNCQNCGDCCGPVPASEKEIENIKKYLNNNANILKGLKKPKALTCIFRNERHGKCLIYPVRPLVCRLMGVAEGLVCVNGNSANIDGFKFMSEVFGKKPELLNMVRWDK